jgi:hypothetical protein
MAFILEVQKFNYQGNKLHPEWNGKCEHIGYMNIIFKSKQQACAYYDKHNPHMRSLNAHNTWRSDYDPNTYLLYIVRERGEEYLKIPPFIEKNENNPIVKFIEERIIKTGFSKDKIGKRALQEEFRKWFEITQGSGKPPKGVELFEIMNQKFGDCKSTGWYTCWYGIKFVENEVDDDTLVEL